MVEAAPVAFDRSRALAVTGAIATATIAGVGINLSVPLLSLEMERMGASGAVIGASTAVAGLASVCTLPFVPRVAARIGVGAVLGVSIGLTVLLLPLFKMTMSIAWWFPLRFFFSIGLGALFVLSEFWINLAAPPERRGLVMGIYATALAIGFAAGPAILVLVGTSGWPPYLAGTLLFALAAVPLLLARSLTPTLAVASRRGVLVFVLAAPVATLASFMYGGIETANFALLPIYALRLGFSAEGAAFLITVLALGNVVFQIPIGLLADRMDRRLLLVAVATVGVAGALAIPSASDTPLALNGLLFAWGGIIGALYTVGLAHLGARFSGADLASANAAFVMLYTLGLVAGPPIVGGAMDIGGPQGFPLTLAAFFALYIVIVLVRLARRRAS